MVIAGTPRRTGYSTDYKALNRSQMLSDDRIAHTINGKHIGPLNHFGRNILDWFRNLFGMDCKFSPDCKNRPDYDIKINEAVKMRPVIDSTIEQAASAIETPPDSSETEPQTDPYVPCDLCGNLLPTFNSFTHYYGSKEAAEHPFELPTRSNPHPNMRIIRD